MKNNNAQLVLTLFLGVMLGSGVGYLLFGTGSAQMESAIGLSNSTAAMEPEARTPVSDAVDLRSSAEEAVRAKPMKAPVAQVSVMEASALLGSVEVAEVAVEEGQGTVFGRIVDEAGQAMAGAVVRLRGRPGRIPSSSPSNIGQGAPERDSLKETVRKAAQSYHDQRARRREVTTDAHGQYRFEGLLDQAWTGYAYLEGFVLNADSSSSSVRIGSELNFTAALVQEVPVAILMPDGVAAERAFVVVTALGGRNRDRIYDWSSNEAFMRLVPGRYKVRALSHGTENLDQSELASSTEKVTLEVGVAPEALTLELAPRLGISGYIRASTVGSNQGSYRVRLLALAKDQEVDLELLARSDEDSRARPGRLFAFTDLEPGRYVVGVSRAWGAPIAVHEVVELSDASAEVLLELPEQDLSQILRVVVTEASGEPLDDVNFRIRQKLSTGTSRQSLSGKRDKDGSYLLTIPAQFHEGYFEDGKDGAEYTLTASHDEMGSTETILKRGQTDLVVTFVVPGRLTVTIPGYSGSGYEGRVRVTASKMGEKDLSRSFIRSMKAKISVAGEQVFEGLEPGDYIVYLTISAKGNNRFSWGSDDSVNSIEMSVREGENSVQLTIPNLYPLRVHWADGKVGKSLHLSIIGAKNQYGGYSGGTLDGDLVASWEDLPAGDYRVQYYSGMSKIMNVTIPCGEIDFTPMLINAMSISITALDGNLAKAGFRDGDLVIGADGKEFERQADIMGLSRIMMEPGEIVDCMVQRGNIVLTIQLKPSGIGDWEDMGGSMTPTTR
ncbi:MAG: hypothetical protein JKY61_06135 [Planctomycetes bacterium]|nr:hypothetical protein [Planctomycetota bacterium]